MCNRSNVCSSDISVIVTGAVQVVEQATQAGFLIKMASYCPQGSGTLRQQLLMMHGIAWYCIILHYLAFSCNIFHYIALSCTILHYIAVMSCCTHKVYM